MPVQQAVVITLAVLLADTALVWTFLVGVMIALLLVSGVKDKR